MCSGVSWARRCVKATGGGARTTEGPRQAARTTTEGPRQRGPERAASATKDNRETKDPSATATLGEGPPASGRGPDSSL